MSALATTTTPIRRPVGARALPALALLAVVGLLLAAVIAPNQTASAAGGAVREWTRAASQDLDLVVAAQIAGQRDAFDAEPKPKPVQAAAAAVKVAAIPDPGTAQAIALAMLTERGWDSNEYNCLVALWDRESRWDVSAGNPVSGAYGIPQALPGEKMAAAGADWETNPATQIAWGLSYIAGRYGTPCAAWQHSEDYNWY